MGDANAAVLANHALCCAFSHHLQPPLHEQPQRNGNDCLVVRSISLLHCFRVVCPTCAPLSTKVLTGTPLTSISTYSIST